MVYSNPTSETTLIAAPTDASLGFPSTPIPRGTTGFFYATVLGALTPQVSNGSGICSSSTGLCTANAMPTVLIGGVTATIQFAGQAPGFPGVSTGSSISVIVTSADGLVTSNKATIAIQ
jgi:uncharacterized protein (TIGR03437 family)